MTETEALAKAALQEKKAQILRLLAKGMSAKRAAAAVGVGHSTPDYWRAQDAAFAKAWKDVRRPLILKPENIRQDAAGQFLSELVERVGGVRALERRLGWPHGDLHTLMRTPKAPGKDHIRDLARVSGRTEEDVAALFGPRRQYRRRRTARLVAFVRSRFPHDPLRMAVVDHIEREGWTLQQYAAAVDVQYDTLRCWLIRGGGLRSAEKRRRQKKGAVHEFFEEPSLRKVAELEGFDERFVADYLRRAREAAREAGAKGGKTRTGRKRGPRSAEVCDRIADAALKRWSDPEWVAMSGQRVIDNLIVMQHEIRADEDTSLAADIRAAIGNFRQKERPATSADVLLILCQIFRRHGKRFPDTALTLEELPDKVEAVLGEPLHEHIRAMGRPRDVRDDIALIRRMLSTPRPRRLFEPGTAERQKWNDLRASFEKVIWYGTLEGGKRAWRDLLHFVIETIAEGPVDMTVFQRGPGRPPGPALDEPEI